MEMDDSNNEEVEVFEINNVYHKLAKATRKLHLATTDKKGWLIGFLSIIGHNMMINSYDNHRGPTKWSATYVSWNERGYH